jgi:hypothetical protein
MDEGRKKKEKRRGRRNSIIFFSRPCLGTHFIKRKKKCG